MIQRRDVSGDVTGLALLVRQLSYSGSTLAFYSTGKNGLHLQVIQLYSPQARSVSSQGSA